MGCLSSFLTHEKKNKQPPKLSPKPSAPIPSPKPSAPMPSPKPSEPSKNISLCSKGGGHYDEKVFKDVMYKTGLEFDWWIKMDAYAKLLNDLANIQALADVSKLIARVPKDMPANPGVRFPNHRGSLEGDNYEPMRFIRVVPELRATFIRLLACGYSENKELFFEVLHDIVCDAVPPYYDTESFECTFGLVWEVKRTDDAAVPVRALTEQLNAAALQEQQQQSASVKSEPETERAKSSCFARTATTICPCQTESRPKDQEAAEAMPPPIEPEKDGK